MNMPARIHGDRVIISIQFRVMMYGEGVRDGNHACAMAARENICDNLHHLVVDMRVNPPHGFIYLLDSVFLAPYFELYKGPEHVSYIILMGISWGF